MNKLQLIKRCGLMQSSLISSVRGMSETKLPLYSLPSDDLKCFKSTKCNSLYLQMCTGFHSSSTEYAMLKKLKAELSHLFSDTTKVKIAGCLVYEKCADTIDLQEFFERFQLPDTFQSWFQVIQLHVWMCIAVTMPQKYGRVFRNSVVDSMWNDVELRMSKLTMMHSSTKKQCLSTLLDQFQAALICYDEGLLGEDPVLAASAWRMFFGCSYVDPRVLESIVLYIRRQICYLDSLHTEKMIMKGEVSFMPLQDVLNDITLNKHV